MWGSVFGLMLFYALFSVRFSFAIILTWVLERAGCFALIIFLVSCDCSCSASLPHSAVVLQCVIAAFPDNTDRLFGANVEICPC